MTKKLIRKGKGSSPPRVPKKKTAKFLLILSVLLSLSSLTLSAEDAREKAEELAEQQRFTEAADILLEWLTVNRENPDYFPTLLMTADLLPDVQRAKDLLEEELRTEKDRARRYEMLSRLALLFELSGDVERAQRSYELAAFIRDREKDFASFYRSAQLLLEMGEYDRAELQARTILGAASESNILLKARLLLARSLLRENRMDEFRLQFDLLIKDKNDEKYSAEDLYSLCLLASETDQPILSDEIIKILSGRFPDSPESRLLAPPADGQAKVEAYPEPGSFMRASASLEEGPAPAPASYIQTGSFIKEKNARELMSGLAAKGFLPVLDLINRNGTVYYRVSVPIEPSLNRQTVLLQLKEAGFEAF